MTVSIKVEGGRLAEAALRELGDWQFIRRAAMEALRAGAIPIRDAAIANAPVDKKDLQKSIKARPGRMRDDILWFEIGVDPAVQPAVWVRRETSKKTRRGSPDLFYRDPGVAGVAPMQEFGTPIMPANPFMLPAWDSEKGATPGRIIASLGPAVEKQAAKIARKAAKVA